MFPTIVKFTYRIQKNLMEILVSSKTHNIYFKNSGVIASWDVWVLRRLQDVGMCSPYANF